MFSSNLNWTSCREGAFNSPPSPKHNTSLDLPTPSPHLLFAKEKKGKEGENKNNKESPSVCGIKGEVCIWKGLLFKSTSHVLLIPFGPTTLEEVSIPESRFSKTSLLKNSTTAGEHFPFHYSFFFSTIVPKALFTPSYFLCRKSFLKKNKFLLHKGETT